MAAIEVKVPDIGDFKDVPVIEVLVKPGDAVKKDDSLVTLESDKATMEVPAPSAGTVKELRVKVGDKVSEGSAIIVLEGAVAAAARRTEGPGHRTRAARAGEGTAPPAARRSRRRRLRQARKLPRPRKLPRRHQLQRPRRLPRPPPPHASSLYPCTKACRRTRAPACAASRASWASTWQASRAPVPRAASSRKTSRVS